MKKAMYSASVFAAAAMLLSSSSCEDTSQLSPGGGIDAGTDADADADGDADADADADADSDADTDSDADSDADSDSDSDAEADGGAGSCIDADGDGWCLPFDCDDGDGTIHPDIDEIWDSGVDEDCDGLTDERDGVLVDGCIPTELPSETSCDMIDNNCNGVVDDVDGDGDGFCDCLNIGILGSTGYAPSSNFEAWLTSMGTTVTRTSLAGTTDGVVTAGLLAGYHVLIIDRIERALSASEAAAVEDFVKTDGRGMIALIGYNFDMNDPQPERDRANSALSAFGLAYQGGYIHTDAGVTPAFSAAHPISAGISDVNFHGGIEPVDVSGLGSSEIFATVPSGDAGLAHQTSGDGGRIVMWGDEWITFDSDWLGYADVPAFWARMLAWVLPVDFCQVPIE